MKAPTKIFIGFFDEDGVPFENPLWCEQSGFEEDTEYIRRDLVEKIIKEYLSIFYSEVDKTQIQNTINQLISEDD